MDLAGKAAHSLAQRSSRRQFFKFMTAGSLGAGLWLTRTDIALGSVVQCAGCGGGPCNPCWSPDPRCNDKHPTTPCKPCSQGGGCPTGCSTSGEWFCCVNGPEPRCRIRCSECTCPAPGGCCHCFTALNIPCRPTTHSGKQPCQCPPLDRVPIAVGAVDG